MTISNEIEEILHPAIVGLESERPDEGDAMYMLGRLVVAVEHLAKHLDEANTPEVQPRLKDRVNLSP